MSPRYSCTEKHVTLLLHKLSTMRELEQAQALATKAGLTHHPAVFSKLVTRSALSPRGSLDHARSLFDSTPIPSPFLYNTMIRAYSQSILPLQALLLYNHMRRRSVITDHFTYPFVLKACGRLLAFEESPTLPIAHKGAEIHCNVLHLGLESDGFVQNALIFMYSQCGHMEMARCVFDEMRNRTLVSWNTMIAGYDRLGEYESADYLLRWMPEKNVVSWNIVVTRHVRLGDIAASKRVFDEMPERDVISWNAMITGYVNVKDYERALELFKCMQDEKVDPTELTLVSVLGVCAETGMLDMGREIHSYLKYKELKIDGFLGNALLDMYAKCGSLKAAREVFDGMGMKHASCWNSMIVGLAVHGHCEEALELFAAMENDPSQVSKPDRITFLGVLIACSHKGLLREGQVFFDKMVKEYGIEPDIKHYGCMVDLLSRCGLIHEAYQMIKEMPMKANSILWKTVLSACRVHGNVELAERSFRELAELGLVGDEEYILMSNIYAEAGRWKDVEQLRTGMIGFSISKPVGCSQIELD